jgi:uncharacterized protein
VKAVFADTFFYVALLETSDEFHDRAVQFIERFDGFVITSRWVLAETLNAVSGSLGRVHVREFLTRLERHVSTKICPASDDSFRQGVELYTKREDKKWSLTDCISFCIMHDEGLTEALTRDHHFSQAGFVPIFADAA